MLILKTFFSNKEIVLALGPESAGNFSLFYQGKIYFSQDFGDLLEEGNFEKFKKSVLIFLKRNKIRPGIILTDLHPLYKTTLFGEELAKRFKAKQISIQHHLAHIFSAFGDEIIDNPKSQTKKTIIGISCDGTGYGLDGKIWGGEIFRCFLSNSKCQRIGHLENQVLIGGDMTIREPARMLISILSKFLNKEGIYRFIKRYYNSNQFELLYNLLKENFNCQETSSTGRILDAVSVLLGFAKNQRKYKHEPIDLLEKNSTLPYKIEPKIIYQKNEKAHILLTTPLFEYLIKNLNKDKRKLAATSQIYLAKGLYQIIKKIQNFKLKNSYFAGGIAKNKIISHYLKSKSIYLSKKIPAGDGGISFGQIFYWLLKNQGFSTDTGD